MKPEELLSQITPKYGVDDVQSDAVETVSVLDFEELESLIAKAVEARTKSLLDELATARKELNELAANGGDGLEAEAAEAALEAEARALEAKADADQLAAAAQSKVAQLEAQLKDLENEEPCGGADPAALEAAEAKAEAAEAATKAAEAAAKAAEETSTTLQSQVDDLRGRLAAAEAATKAAEAKAAEAAEAAPADEDDGEPAKPVTESDLKHARRLAEAFLEEVFMDDEAKSNAAIKDGKAEELFKKEIASAYKQYVKRVNAAVRADSSAWDKVLQDCLKREW